MKKSLIFILLFGLLLSRLSFAQKILTDTETFDHRDCFSGPFAEYDSWLSMITKSVQRKAKTDEELARRLAAFKENFTRESFDHYKESIECSVFKYPVGNLTVSGYVMKPKGQTDVPVLIYNRGGNGRYGAVVFGAMVANLFPMAEQGFAIIGSQYRGAFDKEVVKGKYDEFGGSDVLDVVKLANYIPYIKDANPLKVGMYGSSRGGMQTFLAMQKMPEVNAVASIAGASDLLRELEFRQSMENVYKVRIPNYDVDKEAELEKRSVVKWVDKLDKSVPILIQHGDRDKRVSVENAKWLANALEKSAHPHRLSIYKNEGHSWSPKTKPTAMKELADWFHQHL